MIPFSARDGTERMTREVYFVREDLAFDVTEAFMILEEAPREPVWFDLESATAFILGGMVGIDPERFEDVDPEAPGIAVTLDNGLFLIDGWHRAALRITLLQERMRVYALTAEELSRVIGHVPAEEVECRPEFARQRPLWLPSLPSEAV